MRSVLSFRRLNSLSRRPRPRTRLIGLLGLLVATTIFASSGRARIKQTLAPLMPSLRGEAATVYLTQQGLYNSLGEAVKATRYGATPPRAQPASWDFSQGMLLEGVVATMNDARDVLRHGHVLVRDGRIVAVWDGPIPPAGIDLSSVA